MIKDELTKAWLEAERQAVRAELEVAHVDSAQASDSVQELYSRALELRARADVQFDNLYAHLKDGRRNAGKDGSNG